MDAGRMEQAFKLIEAAAVAGERCPQTRPHGPLADTALADLIKAKRIRTEVYGHNWRVAVILTGPNKGRSTAPHPRGGKAYRVNGAYVDPVERRSGKIAP